jgi:hypothetical protein
MLNKIKDFMQRYNMYKVKIKQLCNEKGLDFNTIIKIAGCNEYAEVYHEACEWYDKNDYCSMILSGKSDEELEKIYKEYFHAK